MDKGVAVFCDHGTNEAVLVRLPRADHRTRKSTVRLESNCLNVATWKSEDSLDCLVQVDWHRLWQRPKQCPPMLWPLQTAQEDMSRVYKLRKLKLLLVPAPVAAPMRTLAALSMAVSLRSRLVAWRSFLDARTIVQHLIWCRNRIPKSPNRQTAG